LLSTSGVWEARRLLVADSSRGFVLVDGRFFKDGKEPLYRHVVAVIFVVYEGGTSVLAAR
jgi:hypothetical protein